MKKILSVLMISVLMLAGLSSCGGNKEQSASEDTGRISVVAGEYGAETADLTIYEYEPFITKDVTHPWNKGWVLIDREIYDFCTAGRKGK